MKKILLSCGASLCLLVADAQLILNEFYVRPNNPQSHQEYFELYNKGMAIENTDCYSLVTYFEQNNEVGLYVVDLPAMTVNGRGYFVGSSQAPTFEYQVGTGNSNMSWNAGNVYRYVYRNGALALDNTGAPFNDIFIKANGTNGGNGVYAMFLFKSGSLVDAFLGNSSGIDVPSYIEQLGTLTHAGGCSSISYNFANIDAEADVLFGNVGSEAGTDNGYHRVPTSVCGGVGTWAKTSAPQEHTPGRVNFEQGGGNNGGTTTGSIAYMLECTSSTSISYNITSGPADAFPVTVTAYHDANGSRTLDDGDVMIGTQTDASASDGQKSFARTSSMEEFIFVFDANGECYDTLAPLNCPAGIVLPVTMKSFIVKRDRSNVSVAWTTASEQNNRGFNIQRSLGNGNWETVAFVRSAAASGNSSSDLSYSYSDINNFRGVSQYRLQQVDADGKASYSEIRTVRGEQQAGKTLVYPNPTSNGVVKLIFDGAAGKRNIIVSDMSGRVVKQWQNVTSDNLQITDLNPGMYMIRVVDPEAGTQSNDKLVVNGR
jgi:hypothetical protein